MTNIESRSGEGIVTTAVAIDKDKNSQYAVKWALENVLKKNSYVALLHVHTQSSSPPDAAIPKDGRAPTESEMQQFFLAFRGFCARKGVRAREVVLQDVDVTTALTEYIVRNSISTVVVGAPTRMALTRAFRGTVDVASGLAKSAPDFCNVYSVSKGKSLKLRSATRPPTPTSAPAPGQPDTPGSDDYNRSWSQSSWISASSERMSFEKSGERISLDKSSDFMQTPTRERLQGGRTSSIQQLTINPNPNPNPNLRVRTAGESRSVFSDFSGPTSFQSSELSFENLDHSRTSDGSRGSTSSQTPEIEDEMRRLRLELKQTMEMYNSACKEATNARQKAIEINLWKSAEARKYEEAKQAEEAAYAMVEMEKQKAKAAMEAAQMAQRLAELESQKRRNAESKAKYEAAERQKAVDALARSEIRYRKYSIEDIELATNYFTNSLKIGEGGYGPVYRAFLDHTAVAIKVLRPDISQGQSQFNREIEVLSCMRHPNMVLLVGACPEYGCLVYEYMENGSLEDRLFLRNNTPPIPWRVRFKISAEIATALLFLHQTRPEPLVHRDLKPANILLDRNYVSKISDVGLARLVPPSVADSVTQYHMTSAAGTFCYIDPEYQQTGMLGTKSDIYSLGVMLLQIITAKNAMGLTHQVSRAIEKGTFSEILDPAVTDWPVEEALSFAKLALQCCELRRKDRPDLGSVILPELERLRDLGSEHGASFRGTHGYGPTQYTSSFDGRSSLSQESKISNHGSQVESQVLSMDGASISSGSTLGNLMED